MAPAKMVGNIIDMKKLVAAKHKMPSQSPPRAAIRVSTTAIAA